MRVMFAGNNCQYIIGQKLPPVRLNLQRVLCALSRFFPAILYLAYFDGATLPVCERRQPGGGAVVSVNHWRRSTW